VGSFFIFKSSRKFTFANPEFGHTYFFEVKEESLNLTTPEGSPLQTAWSEPYEVPSEIGPPEIALELQPQPSTPSPTTGDTTGCIFLAWHLETSGVFTEVEFFRIFRDGEKITEPDRDARSYEDCGLEPFTIYKYVIHAVDRFDSMSVDTASASIDPLWVFTPKVRPFTCLRNPVSCDQDTAAKFFNADSFDVKWGWIRKAEDSVFGDTPTLGADSVMVQISIDPTFVNFVDSSSGWKLADQRSAVFKKPDFVTITNDTVYVRIKAKDRFNNESPWSTEYDELGSEIVIFDAVPPPHSVLVHSLGLGFTSDTSRVNIDVTWPRPNEPFLLRYEAEIVNLCDQDTTLSLPLDDEIKQLEGKCRFRWTPGSSNKLELIAIREENISPENLPSITISSIDHLLNRQPDKITEFIQPIHHTFNLSPDTLFFGTTDSLISWNPFLQADSICYVVNYFGDLSALGFPFNSDTICANIDSFNFYTDADTTAFGDPTTYFHVGALIIKPTFTVTNWSNFVVLTEKTEAVNSAPILSDIDEESVAIPANYALHQNYPNPFNPSTRIKYDLPREEQVLIRVFDLYGREVVTLVDRKVSAGEYEMIWNGHDARGNSVSSGVYFIVFKTESYRDTKKCLLVK
jgi:hypothetical protein